MSFVITIETKDQEARSKVRSFGTELDGAAAKGSRVGASVGQGMREGAAATDRTTRSVQALAKSFGGIGTAILREQLDGVSKSFAGLADQMERESAMLERIQKPMKDFQGDLAAVNNLFRQGLVDEQQYRAELEKIGALHGPSRDQAGASPESLQQKMLSGAMTAGATTFGLHEIKELGDEYLNLKNRLRSVATDEDNLNNLMTKTRTIANDTRSDWESVANVYTRLQIALRDTGASQQQVLDMTKTLSQGLQISGATAFEAQMSMMELSHALQTGALQGREFRVLMKDAAPLMAELQKVSGKTAAEFAEMGKHGKLTAELLMDLFAKAGPAIQEKFAKTVPTMTQQWIVFKNELVASVGSFVEASHIIPIVGNVLGDMMSVIKPLLSGLGSLASGLVTLGQKAAALGHVFGVDLEVGLGTFVGYVMGGPVGAALGTLAEGILKTSHIFQDTRTELEMWPQMLSAFAVGVATGAAKVNELHINIDGLDEGLKKISTTIPDVTEKFLGMLIGFDAWDPGKTKKALDNYGQVLKDIKDPTRNYVEMLKAANDYYSNTKDLQGYTIELNKLNKALLSAYELKAKAGRKGPDAAAVANDIVGRMTKNEFEGMEKALRDAEKLEKERAALAKKFDSEVSGIGSAMGHAAREAEVSHITEATKKWNDELGQTKKRADEIVGALRPVEDMLVELANTGEVSWQKMIDSMIAEAERFAAHEAIVDLVHALFGGGGSSLASTAGGASSDSISGGIGAATAMLGGGGGAAALGNLFGGASGNSWIVGGSGGTDSQIAALRASPGERLSVETPAQQAANDAQRGGWGGPMKVQIVDGRDRRGLLRGNTDVTRIVLDDMSRDPRRYRSAIGRA